MKNAIPILLSLFLTIPHLGAAEKPNIIVIYTDDHGWPDIGAAGIYDDLKTPHLDALAANGARATNGYSTAPQCIPSRAGLLTGKSQNRFGVESNGLPLDGFDREETIAERLKQADYTTAQIGKWHLGPSSKIGTHGFDYFYNKNANRPAHGNFAPATAERFPTKQIPHTLYHLDDCSRAAVSFIRKHQKDPFFLYLAYRAPHVPLDAPRHHLSRFPGEMPERRRQALAMIAAMDDGVGAITSELKKLGIEKDTLIFYIGDNGAPLKIHKLDAPGGGPGWDGSLNKPMNGEKGMLSEGGIRVPFVIAWPGKISPKQVYSHPISALDVAATAVELAGLQPDKNLDGVNLIPFLTGEENGAPHEVLTWRWIAQSAIRTGRWKLLRGGSREYLYDLEADPGELNNLAQKNPEIANRLRQQLKSWSQELSPPGLTTTTQLAATWNRYFDFYLDGKPSPPRKATKTPGDLQGWIARGATLSVNKGALRTQQQNGQNFLVKNGLKQSGPINAKIKIQTELGGTIAIAWREAGQKDFQPAQITKKVIPSSTTLQDIELEVPTTSKVIHIRLHLPAGANAISSITLDSKTNPKTWNFGKPPKSKPQAEG